MLTALELTGFKSFADKTRLDIPAGVTCVVGPNGSGKSNVVDAVKWVLGSQSPKALRGSEMTDVIFNGASGRRPLNTAEVTLEFDNRSGLFELKEPTVRITRRVYRSGEGEYAINGAACRLRDIRQLLAGTGVGAESYNIIEQGRVDAVLRASPKDRRALFEEAAGISRFRLKKQEAARRLARVEQNLLRLSDIVDEVEGRLRRVRMQAGKARRYREQSDRLQELRTQLGLADWRVLTARLEELEHVRTRLASQGQQQAEQIEQGDAHLQKLEQHTDTSAEELAAVERKLSATRELLAARQSEVASNTDRLAELEDALMHARRRLVATRIEARSRSDGVSVSDLESRLADQRQSLAAAQQTAAGAERALHEHRRKLQTFLAEQKQYSSRRQACEEELAAAQREADRVQVRLEVAQSQLAEH
ncbi:MAG: AAA family ATPase, partial [Planctomycetota bacterium]